MEISGVSGVAGNSRVAGSGSMDAQSFALRVLAAIGPKFLNGNGLQGRVMVAFSLGSDGALAGARVTQSSGEQSLDARALQIVGSASFPSPPAGLSVANRSYVSIFTFQ